MENPITMDDLGVPLFLETSMWVLKDLWEGKKMVVVFLFFGWGVGDVSGIF